MRYHLVWFINGATLLAVDLHRQGAGRDPDPVFVTLGVLQILMGGLHLVIVRRRNRPAAARAQLVAAFREAPKAPTAGVTPRRP